MSIYSHFQTCHNCLHSSKWHHWLNESARYPSSPLQILCCLFECTPLNINTLSVFGLCLLEAKNNEYQISYYYTETETRDIFELSTISPLGFYTFVNARRYKHIY